MLKIKDLKALENGGHGINIDAAANVELENVQTSGNAGRGLNVVQGRRRERWYKQYLGQVAAGVTVIALTAATFWDAIWKLVKSFIF